MKRINLYYGWLDYTITIDANRHPDYQLNKLLELLRTPDMEVFNIFSNSIYVINELTIIQGFEINGIPDDMRGIYSGIGPFEIKHYEIGENGKAVEGEYYREMISDNNLLNNRIGEGNDRYSNILDMADQLAKGINIKFN